MLIHSDFSWAPAAAANDTSIETMFENETFIELINDDPNEDTMAISTNFDLAECPALSPISYPNDGCFDGMFLGTVSVHTFGH